MHLQTLKNYIARMSGYDENRPMLAAASAEIERLHQAIRNIASECNCRAEHGADGAEHLLAIEKMLEGALA